ncbi:MAG: SGNH/GDSL hydrolase family protein [Leptospiraceae bacterium]|nr:SGNH/GDSL hydrolase family protein [Leptospiraceae bacterium]
MRYLNRQTFKLFSFSLITFLLFILLLHWFFIGLCKINHIPGFRFDTFLDSNIRLDNPNFEKELTEGDILIYLPQSKLRKSTPDGLTLNFAGENVTYFSGYRRTIPVQKEKVPGVKRVIAVGDSFTWGWKVSDQNTVSSHLEQVLNQRKPENVKAIEVLNAGMTASTITHSYESLKNYDLKFAPDVVLLTFCENDIADLKQKSSTDAFTYDMLKKIGWFGPIRFFVAGKYKKEREIFLRQLKEMKQNELIGGKFGAKSHISPIHWPNDVMAFMKTKIGKQDIENLLTFYYLGNEGKIVPYTRTEDVETWELWKEWEETLVKMKRLSESKKFKLIVYTYPIFVRIYEPQFDKENTPENIIDAICKRHGVTHVNPLAKFREADIEMRKENKFIYMLPEDGHPTSEGNILSAKILADEILPFLKE